MHTLYSSKTDFITDLHKAQPRLIFLTGKTSTGKTTLSNQLKGQGYQVVNLDPVVIDSVVKKFKVEEQIAFRVYGGKVAEEWISSFVEAARVVIMAALEHGPVIVEGALANNGMLKKVFSGQLNNFLFTFLHPTDSTAYAMRITERYVAGIETNTTDLPEYFLNDIKEETKNYLLTKKVDDILARRILDFAQWSIGESQRRLDYFREEFDKIVVIEV